MRAGHLRHLIEIQKPVETRTDDGGVTTDWKTIDNVWAEVKPIKSDESVTADRKIATMTHAIRIRYYPRTITNEHRILFGSRVFSIEGPPVDEYERNREMVIPCKEILGHV